MTREAVAALTSVESQISRAEFGLFQNFILDRAGIRLNESKRALLVGRLAKRLRQLGLESFNDYYRRLVADEDEHVTMLDLITTNETAFFREPRQFAFLESDVIPAWVRDAEGGNRERRVRVWSAGCSTGEEPYSISMLQCRSFEIVATDLSTRVIEAAANGVWPDEKLAKIPVAYRRPYVLRGTGARAGSICIADVLRPLIRFRRVNLADQDYDVQGPFDLVFCRNVLIYFDPVIRQRVVHRLIDRCAIGGYFFLGHAEALHGFGARLASIRPTMLRRKA